MNSNKIDNNNFHQKLHDWKKTSTFVAARISGYLGELISLIALVALYVFRQTLFDPKPDKIRKNIAGVAYQQPILLVHGYLHNSSGWIYHRHKLKKAGFDAVFTVDLGALPTKSIAQYADVLQKRIEEIALITGRKDIKLVGHSMGGVVSSYYATHLAEKKGVNVTDVITLLSPLRGTKAHVIGIGPCVKDMAYESEFSKTLSEHIEKPQKTRFFHIASKADPIILPYSSALNALSKSEIKNSEKTHLVSHLGHAAALFSKEISNLIIERIQNNISD